MSAPADLGNFLARRQVALHERDDVAMRTQHIVTLRELNRVLPKPKEKKTVVVGGCFDILHVGHRIITR